MTRSRLYGEAFDVIVCGAGSAGWAAACAASRAGARTLLLERYGFCGGTPTTAMIHTFDAIRGAKDHDATVVAGLGQELLDEIAALGGTATDDNPPEALVVHPEIHKIACDRLLERSGVTVLLHAHVTDVVMEGNAVRGVVASLRDGSARFHAPVVVDGTGDGDLILHSGAAFEQSDELQALTYHFRLGNLRGNLNWEELEAVSQRAMQAAYAQGKVQKFGGPWVIRLSNDEVSINSTRVYGNPVDPVELSAAEAEGRSQMLKIWETLRAGVPEFADSYILAGASMLHIRESRKLIGEYVLTEQDIFNGVRHQDAIALGTWPIDIHPTNGFVGVHPHKDLAPEPYEIPYRCLVPQKVDGLLVAGRPISTTHRAHGSTRVPGTSLATGQAAGVAAALAASAKVEPRAVDIEDLRSTLRQQGAIISADDKVRN